MLKKVIAAAVAVALVGSVVPSYALSGSKDTKVPAAEEKKVAGVEEKKADEKTAEASKPKVEEKTAEASKPMTAEKKADEKAATAPSTDASKAAPMGKDAMGKKEEAAKETAKA